MDLLISIYQCFDSFKFQPNLFDDTTIWMSMQKPNYTDMRYIRKKFTQFLSATESSVVPLPKFFENWKYLSGNLFDNFNWNNVVVAGGAILACLLPGMFLQK